jgi:hypothetical protein
MKADSIPSSRSEWQFLTDDSAAVLMSIDEFGSGIN